MAARHGKYTGVFYDAADLSPYFKEAGVSRKADVAETSAFGSSAKTYVVGLVEGGMSASGMFEGAEDAVDDRMNSVLGVETPSIATFCPDGVVIGRACHSAQVRAASYEVSSPVNDVVAVSTEMQADGAVLRGVLLGARTAASSTADGASSDNGAASTDGGAGFLHVTANTRDGASTIKVQHSVDNSVFVDLITFTSVPASTTASERIATTGTVNRYVRARHTPGGSTGSITYTLAFARN